MHEEELETKFGKRKAQVYMANCKKLVKKGHPEMVEQDKMFKCDTFLLSRKVQGMTATQFVNTMPTFFKRAYEQKHRVTKSTHPTLLLFWCVYFQGV